MSVTDECLASNERYAASFGGELPLLTQYVQFRITPADSTGNWRIDDVYLDPLMHL